MHLPTLHICIVQPVGYVHALGFLDQARYMRYQFRRMGVAVTLAKNRLRHDAVNIVFGAHLGFDPELCGRHSCVFVNLEQLGDEGAVVPSAYLDLLGRSAVIDYHAANVTAYTTHVDDVPLISFGYAPYLARDVLPIERRPIDILFFGSVNDRRKAMFERIETSGQSVTLIGGPLYGPERDELIVQARAVFNCHFYDSARFEQARAFQCLSLGTPVISERCAGERPPSNFEESVIWLSNDQIESYFRDRFAQPGYADEARARLDAFKRHDVVDAYADVLAFAAGYHQIHTKRRPNGPWRPQRLHIGSGKDYKPGWFNVDVLESAQPDALLDLARPQFWPQLIDSPTAGPVLIEPGSLDIVFANNVLEHVPDLPRLMGNCLILLRDGGEMVVEVPYEQANTAWQDPTHVRAMNENSWIYYAEWFWYLGWFESRFRVNQFTYLDARLQPCAKSAAQFMRVRLGKVATTLAEKMTARTMRADFGGLPDDLDDPGSCIAEDASLCAGEAESERGRHARPKPISITLATRFTATSGCDDHVASARSTSRGSVRGAAPPSWVVLTPGHDDGVTQNFARSIAAGLHAVGERAVVLTMGQGAADRLIAMPVGALAGLITVGAVPLTLSLNGVPLHRAIACPVYMYLLDSPIYDLVRVPVTRRFIADAWLDDRLVPVLAENSYLQLLRSGGKPVLPPQSRYLPFGAFPAEAPGVTGVQMQQRLLVIGTLGRELARAAVRPDLLQTIRGANSAGLADHELVRLSEQLLAPQARGNVVAHCADLLALDCAVLLDPAIQSLVCAADSHLKRERRLAAVQSLSGVPVDFIGPGWQEVFAGEPGFRFLGSVDHADLGRLMPLYRGIVNFDPNWEWGQHDRVYTALACGVPVLTHANTGILDEGLPASLLHTFAPNAPALGELAHTLLASAISSAEAVPLSRVGWTERVGRLLGKTPHAARPAAEEFMA